MESSFSAQPSPAPTDYYYETPTVDLPYAFFAGFLGVLALLLTNYIVTSKQPRASADAAGGDAEEIRRAYIRRRDEIPRVQVLLKTTNLGERLPNWHPDSGAHSSSDEGADAEPCDKPECCAICLGDLEPGDWAKVLKCGHGYHAECLDEWLGRSSLCPLCKREAEPPPAQVPPVAHADAAAAPTTAAPTAMPPAAPVANDLEAHAAASSEISSPLALVAEDQTPLRWILGWLQ
jgi:hypothetical protein